MVWCRRRHGRCQQQCQQLAADLCCCWHLEPGPQQTLLGLLSLSAVVMRVVQDTAWEVPAASSEIIICYTTGVLNPRVCSWVVINGML